MTSAKSFKCLLASPACQEFPKITSGSTLADLFVAIMVAKSFLLIYFKSTEVLFPLTVGLLAVSRDEREHDVFTFSTLYSEEYKGVPLVSVVTYLTVN